MKKTKKSITEVTSNFSINAGSFSWQQTYFEMLHDALIDSFNETIKKAKETDAEWKDNESIKFHVEESGLLEQTLKKVKVKFLEEC